VTVVFTDLVGSTEIMGRLGGRANATGWVDGVRS